MDNKDLLAQNSEEKTDDAIELAPSPKKRITRKKTDSQKTSDAQKENDKNITKDSDSTFNEADADTVEPDSVDEAVLVSEIDEEPETTLLTISLSNFQDTSENEETKPEAPETDDIDFIPTPDEIFAKIVAVDNPTELPEENEENEPIEPEYEIDTTDDDGQYTFSDIERYKFESSAKASNEVSKKEYNPLKPRHVDRFFDFVELVVFTLLAVMVVTSFLFRHSIVDGESMENTLHSREHLIISDLFYTPNRGDVIVCEDYTTAIPKPIVKRVIAIEGDTVKITPEGDVFVNGILIDESKYVNIDEFGYKYKELELTVPENELFVMGDHRNKSTDSREIGTVSEDSVLGKVLLRFYPFNKFGKVD